MGVGIGVIKLTYTAVTVPVACCVEYDKLVCVTVAWGWVSDTVTPGFWPLQTIDG